MNVSVFTSGLSVPSSRMRVRQFIPALAARGIAVTEHASAPEKYAPVPFGLPKTIWTGMMLASRARAMAEARHADVVWLERELVVGRETLEPFLGRAQRRVLDVDDAIWMYGKKGYSESIASKCAGVIAGNSYLAEHYKKHTKHVWIVPTSVDTHVWARPNDARRGARSWVIGWTGTASNFPYLYGIEDALAAFLADRPDAEILVVADRAPEWKKIPAKQARFEKWTSDGEPRAVHGMDVGLMPLANEEWAKGKCAAKMLVYMAASLPVVVSPVGVNADVLAQGDVGFAATGDDQWLRALTKLYEDRPSATAMGERGRALVERAYSVTVSAAALADIFNSVARAA